MTGTLSVGHRDGSEQRWALVPITVALVLIASIFLRYGGNWAETDTSVLTRAGRGVLNEGTIVPDRYAYDHGFAYPTLIASLSTITGVSIRTIQVMILPWLIVGNALIAFVAFRAVTRSARAGAVAASLLLVQPDYLFVIQRGSHEKTTWMYVLVLIFALVTSLGQRNLRQVTPFVILFYLCGFAFLCTNAFFGSSFTLIVLLTLLGSLIISRRFFRVYDSRKMLPRLTYIFLILTSLVYLIIFYFYPPAETNLANAGRIIDRVATLYFNVDTRLEERVATEADIRSNADVATTTRTVSPYTTVSLGWVSTRAFFLLTVFTWVMLATTIVAWLVLAVTFLRRGVSREEVPLFIVWAFTAAAAIQITGAIGSDYAGAAGGNLQLRLFPLFTVFAVPLVITTVTRYRIPPRSKVVRGTATALALGSVILVANAFPELTIFLLLFMAIALYLGWSWGRPSTRRVLVPAIGAVAFSYFAGAAILKATIDPLVSNKWIFYSAAEARGLQWGDDHLASRFIWADFDERLGTASTMLRPDTPLVPQRALWTRSRADVVRYRFMSDISTDRAIRIRGLLPDVRGDSRIYDNGTVQITHRVPDTPYQP